ncbi:MAG: DUF3488 and transglutaminase-like domain-containing protein [Gammaproteobacteria bacterium]|nr:DUF3488 and transglutaminase-like domain-containing protein [Gammaproteobacteria bacterium]MCF6230565.1 DUF3488 and transglutaminase-like domain-containing protein [Gammaproteobacteria bacterium]
MIGWRKQKPKRYQEEQQAAPASGVIWLLGALLLVILPHLFRQPGWVAATCLAILGWRLLKEFNGWALPRTVFRLLLAATLLAGTYLQYRTLNGLDAGTTLLTLMLCLKLIELRTLRDAMIVILLGYFLVLSGFLYDQSILSGLYLLLVVLLLTASLLVLNHSKEGQQQAKKEYFKRAAAILLQALPLVLILFILVPRIPGPLWALPNNSSSATTGLSDKMSIGDITRLADSDAVAFRASFTGEIPAADQLYWRGPILWQTDGRNWSTLNKLDPFNAMTAAPFTHLSEPIEYSITLPAHQQRWLFALDLPVTQPEKSFLRRDFQLLHQDKINELYRYTVRSVLDYKNSQLLPQERKKALQLPPNRNPQTRALAQQWRQQAGSDQQLVTQALDYFQQQPFYYSRTPPALRGEPIDQFLFTAREGFCEHYAAAFVTLMRAAGVPARVVTGYQGGEYNALGDYLLVRQSDAHAWAEVWLPAQGWIRVDPTRVIPPDRIEAYEDLQRFTDTRNDKLFDPNTRWLQAAWLQTQRGWDAANHQWSQWVVGFDQQQQQRLLERLGLGKLNLLALVGIMALLILLLLAALSLYLLSQRQKQLEPLQQAYQTLCLQLAKRGVDNAPWLGPKQRCQQAMRKLPKQRQEIKSLFNHYIQLRYTTHQTPNAQRAFIQAVRRFRC